MLKRTTWFTNTVCWLCASLSLAGCQRPYIMTQLDYSYYNSVTPETIGPPAADAEELVPGGDPRTVVDPEARKDWKLTLEDVKRIALQNNKEIAYLGYEPGVSGTQIERELSRFDPFVDLGGQWAYSDSQVSNLIQVFGTGANSLNLKSFGSSAGGFGVNTTDGGATSDFPTSIPGQNVFSIFKRHATGGLGRIYYSLDYQNTDPVGLFTNVNPAWRSTAGVQLEQPLLQGAGVEFNRAPILIARANHEQAIKTFEVQVQTLLRDVEYAYWDLFFTYEDLYSREAGMEQALVTWQIEKNKEIYGKSSPANVAQAREQFEFYRAQRLIALNSVLNAERELRELMGITPDDEYRILPADEPTFARYHANWDLAVTETMELRPDIEAQRFAVRSAELEVLRQRNGLLPDLTVNAGYLLQGLDNQWDQSIDRLTDNKFEAWTLGIRIRRQVGERSANASVRRAQLFLSQSQGELRNLEHTALHELTQAYQNLTAQYQLTLAQKDRREAAAEYLRAREQVYRQGKETIDILLRAQTAFADALRDESQALVDYNKALIQWEFVRGRILANDNVVLAEQRISLANNKLLQDRKKWWEMSLPVQIHPGSRVHGDLGCPPNTAPLYGPNLWGDEAESTMPTEEPVPSEELTPLPQADPLPPQPSPPSPMPEPLSNVDEAVELPEPTAPTNG